MAGMLKGFRGLVMPEALSVPASMEIEIYKDRMVSYSLLPLNSTNQKIRWSSADTSIATIDENGIISGVSVGETTITGIVDANGITESLTLIVTVVHVTGVTLNKSSIEVNAGESFQLTATVTPSDASSQNVTWSSSNTSVAVVDGNGLVTYVGDGNATITCTTVDGGYTATCGVTCVSFVPIDTCFGYTGAEQSILLKSHTYCLEVWGAQGANSGGKGGYSGGCIALSSDTCVYIYVGQCGYNSANSAFNGGGRGSCTGRGGGGGGGTDIRIGGNTLYHRRIVAGGGGGKDLSWNCCAGGVGGGCTGGSAPNGKSSSASGYGGTQTAAGGYYPNGATATGSGFGVGGYGNCSDSNYYAVTGGGGGWYGGGGGQANSGGGGSGYVYTSSTCSSTPSGYCHCTTYFLTNAVSCCGAVSFPSPSGSTETGHTGHGCVRIRSL